MKSRQGKGQNLRPDNRWVCSHKLKNGTESCLTRGILESELNQIINSVLIDLSNNINDVVEKYVLYLKQSFANVNYDKKIKEIELKIHELARKKDKLLELSLDNMISNSVFKERNDQYNIEINALNSELLKYEQEQNSQHEKTQDIFKIKKELLKFYAHTNEQTKLTHGIIDTFIDKIYVTAVNDSDMKLDIYLKTGQMRQENLGSRSGHILKIVKAAHECGARFIYAAMGMTMRERQREYYYEQLERHYPGLKEKYIARYRNRYDCSVDDAKIKWSLFALECDKYGILYNMKDIIRAYKLGYESTQLKLF